MEIKTFEDLIDWTRQVHSHLAENLHESAGITPNQRASALMDYLSEHERRLAKTIAEFERQADPKALKTRLYDYTNHHKIETHRTCDTHYANLDFEAIEREVFDVHDQVMALYDTLIGKAEIPEAKSLLEDLKALEQHEAMRLARQIGRMDDL
ncbi:ATPase [uncultured Marinobacter sp.]|uniref:ATPase n=1 Tax=uncultured Marinobacter sp. TaxID=187379 RepID=UPI0032B28C2C|tara:strand:- start:3245 stop:3703 length:459 start_codon:yes stop_codon:yes gene_type:complete